MEHHSAALIKLRLRGDIISGGAVKAAHYFTAIAICKFTRAIAYSIREVKLEIKLIVVKINWKKLKTAYKRGINSRLSSFNRNNYIIWYNKCPHYNEIFINYAN